MFRGRDGDGAGGGELGGLRIPRRAGGRRCYRSSSDRADTAGKWSLDIPPSLGGGGVYRTSVVKADPAVKWALDIPPTPGGGGGVKGLD